MKMSPGASFSSETKIATKACGIWGQSSYRLYENASPSRLTHLILVLPQVLLCHSVYVFLRFIEGQFAGAPTDHGNIVGIGLIADIERDLGIPRSIPVFLTPFKYWLRRCRHRGRPRSA